MNFSIPIKYSGSFSYSPNNKYFAIIKGTEIHVYDSQSLSFTQKFTFNDVITNSEWSQDSNLLLISFNKQTFCEVKSLDSQDWICRIDEGIAGLSSCRWSPDSRRILTVCDFNLRLTIWSLIDKSSNFINYPKYNDKGISYTSNNYFMAHLERKECKDYIGIYYISDWTLVSHFCVDTMDAQNLLWSKDDGAIIVWDNALECKFISYSPTGNIISVHQAYELSLGIKNCCFSPNGNYLSVGYYDQSLRLFSHITWKQITEFQHKSTITDKNTVS